MRILQIVNIGFEHGGAEKSVRLIRQGLTARGHEVRVLATDLLAAQQDVFADELVPAISGNAVQRLGRYFWYQRGYRRTREVMDRFRPDCVHLHTIGEFSPSVLAATAGAPRLLTVHGPEDWTGSLLRWSLPGASGGRLTPAARARLAYLRCLQRPAYLPRLRRVDRVLAPSSYFAAAVADDVARVPVHVLPNGIESTARPEPVRDTLRVLYAGRLETVKGVHVLLDAFRRVLAVHPAACLDVVGDGGARASLETSARDLTAAGRAVFHGWVPEAAVAQHLRAASLLVVPSLWPENFPTVALEALQLGRPLVASEVGGLPELVGADNGLLVPAGDADRLGAALSALLGNGELLRKLGDGSAARALRYRVEDFLDALELHYEEVTSA